MRGSCKSRTGVYNKTLPVVNSPKVVSVFQKPWFEKAERPSPWTLRSWEEYLQALEKNLPPNLRNYPSKSKPSDPRILGIGTAVARKR